MKDVTPRVLMKQLGLGQVGFDMTDSSPAIDGIVVSGQGWENIPQDNLALATLVLANRTYIDLEGYSQEELTTFVQGVDFQHFRDPLQGGAAVSALVQRFHFLTTRRITDGELAEFTSAVAPGYLASTLDLMEMIYGEHRTYAVNTTIPGSFVTTDTDTLGSGNPTAGARLHWTQVYVINPVGENNDPGTFIMYPVNLVAQAVTGKEKDLVYIERLRRAYTQDAGRNS